LEQKASISQVDAALRAGYRRLRFSFFADEATLDTWPASPAVRTANPSL
jgi:hypothetical protein